MTIVYIRSFVLYPFCPPVIGKSFTLRLKNSVIPSRYLLAVMFYLLQAVAKPPVLIACYLKIYYAYLLAGNIFL